MKAAAVLSLFLLLGSRTVSGQPGGWCLDGYTPCDARPCAEGKVKVFAETCNCPAPGRGFGCGPKPPVQEYLCSSFYYLWSAEQFGPCEAEGGCGIGQRTRKVSCKRCDGLEVEDRYCPSFTPKPAATESCVLLPSRWKHGEWSECNAQKCLGIGKVKREVICEPCSKEFPANNYDRCPEESKPAEEESCQGMSYEWEVVPSTCRPGARREDGCLDGTRDTVCKACDGSEVDRSRCSGSAPVENCVVEVFEWSLSGWTGCRGCPATRSRNPECRSMCPLDGGAGVVGEASCKGIKPGTVTETCPVAGGAFAWGRWLGGCSRNSPCETGTERRRCLRKCDQSVVSDRLCPGGEAAATRPCGAPTYKWGAWGTCFGSTCGGDGTRTRKCLRVCSDSSESVVDAGRCRSLGQGSDQERCEYLPSDWQARPWGPCSAQGCLENGHRDRDVRCVPCSGAGSRKKHLDCDPKKKPRTRESCEHVFHEWVVLPQCDVRSTLPSGCKDGVKRTACRRCLSSRNVDDSLCKDKPRPQVKCQVDNPTWQWGPYGDCPTSCGVAERKREAWCKSACTGRAVADGRCPQPKPLDLNPRACQSYPGGFEWTGWGSCQKDTNQKCAVGWKTRRCRAKCGVKPIVSSENCSGDERAVCAPLTYSWSKWGPCSVKCGTGKRVRRCLRDCDGKPSNTGFCPGSAEESCSSVTYSWRTVPNTCEDLRVKSGSTTCFTGVLDTQCKDCRGRVVSDRHCSSSRPRTSCVACGVGTRCKTRSVPVSGVTCHKDLECRPEFGLRPGLPGPGPGIPTPYDFYSCMPAPGRLPNGAMCKIKPGLQIGYCSGSCRITRSDGNTYCASPQGVKCGRTYCPPDQECVRGKCRRLIGIPPPGDDVLM